jgi:hypothetical protein
MQMRMNTLFSGYKKTVDLQMFPGWETTMPTDKTELIIQKKDIPAELKITDVETIVIDAKSFRIDGIIKDDSYVVNFSIIEIPEIPETPEIEVTQ